MGNFIVSILLLLTNETANMAKNKLKTDIKKMSAKSAPSSTTAPPSAPRRPVPEWVIVGILAVLTVVLRWQFLDIPLERDESVYYYIGKTALEGGRPYFDFYEMKPPGLFYSYALLVGLFGYSGVGAHLALLFVSLSNMIFTYLIARDLGGKSMAAIAALAFIFFSLNPGASGLYLVAEHVALLWGLPGIWLAMHYPDRPSMTRLLLSGILLSLSVLVKQTAAVFGMAVVIYWLMMWLQHRPRPALKPLVWWIAGGIIPLLGAWMILWASGTLEAAKFWLLDYSQRYASSVDENKIGLYFDTSWKLVSGGYEGYFMPAAAGLLALWWSRLSLAAKVFITSFALLSAGTIVPGFRFYGHYYLLAFPAVCIAGAMLFYTISVRISKKNTMSIGIVLIGLLWSVHHIAINSNMYIQPPLRFISRTFSPGNPFVEHQILSEELGKVIQPNDTIAVFGSDLQYFIYLDKKSPIRHVYMPFIAKGQFPEAVEWQNETIRVLRETRPKYVIFNAYPYAWMARFDKQNRLTRNILEFLNATNYDPYLFIEADSRSKPAVVKFRVQQGAVKNDVNYIQVYKRRDGE